MPDSATSWTTAHQDSLSMMFSRQGYWNGSPFPSPGIFPTQGSKLGLLHCRQILVKTVTRTQSLASGDQSFGFRISPSSEYSELISFNICLNHPVNDIFIRAVQTSYDKHGSKSHSVQTQSCERSLTPWFLMTVLFLWLMTNSPLSLSWTVVGDILIFDLPSRQKANLQ